MKNIKDLRIAIISATFHKQVTDNLEKHCLETLNKKGLTESRIDVVHIPGALEIPLTAKILAKKKIYDAIIVFGAIHKGKTTHFELISSGCMDVSLEFEIPVIFEMLTVMNIADAMERATREQENKGDEAALTALKMIEMMGSL